jgi:hypothetical protein
MDVHLNAKISTIAVPAAITPKTGITEFFSLLLLKIPLNEVH